MAHPAKTFLFSCCFYVIHFRAYIQGARNKYQKYSCFRLGHTVGQSRCLKYFIDSSLSGVYEEVLGKLLEITLERHKTDNKNIEST